MVSFTYSERGTVPVLWSSSVGGREPRRGVPKFSYGPWGRGPGISRCLVSTPLVCVVQWTLPRFTCAPTKGSVSKISPDVPGTGETCGRKCEFGDGTGWGCSRVRVVKRARFNFGFRTGL